MVEIVPEDGAKNNPRSHGARNGHSTRTAMQGFSNHHRVGAFDKEAGAYGQRAIPLGGVWVARQGDANGSIL